MNDASGSSSDSRAAYVEDFSASGAVKQLEFLFDPEEGGPLSQPSNLFDFIDLFDRSPDELPPVGDYVGTEVAVVGAGCAGMAAAQLLMRAGLKPVVYELSDRIGGRTYSRPFEGSEDEAVAELGAMRIPLSQKLVFHMLGKWDIPWHPFPNPLEVDTVVDVFGEQVFYDARQHAFTKGPEELIDRILQVRSLYKALVDPIVATWAAVEHDYEARKALWRNYVQLYDKKSFYQTLLEAGWTTDQIDLFGFIGIGSGGFDSFYGSSFLEIVRIEIQKLETKQQIVVGGTEQIPQNLWHRTFECRHWGRKSVESLHDGGTRPGVQKIRVLPDDRCVEITDLEGVVARYPATVLTPTPRAIDMTMDIDRAAFSLDVWTALNRLEIVANAKIFILTKQAFWKDPASAFKLHMTLTDQPPRQIYLFDIDDFIPDSGRKPAEANGVICLSYAWGASSIKFDALDDSQRVRVCLDAIEKMSVYGPEMRREIERQTIGVTTLTWEDAYGYGGGWRMANPGQAEDVHVLHQQTLGLPHEWDNGLYLAGEALSWYGLSGWIDGALKTGMQAGLSAIRRVSRK